MEDQLKRLMIDRFVEDCLVLINAGDSELVSKAINKLIDNPEKTLLDLYNLKGTSKSTS